MHPHQDPTPSPGLLRRVYQTMVSSQCRRCAERLGFSKCMPCVPATHPLQNCGASQHAHTLQAQPHSCHPLTALLRHLVQLRIVPRLAAISRHIHPNDALAAAAPGVTLDCITVSKAKFRKQGIRAG